MGGHISKRKSSETSLGINHRRYLSGLSSYEASCITDEVVQTFDQTLHTQTTHVINSFGGGVEVGAVSLDSLRKVLKCMLDMEQQVVGVFLKTEEDIYKTSELFELVDLYFQNSLLTKDFCDALESYLNKVRSRQVLVVVALDQFEREDCEEETRYRKALDTLKQFKEAEDPDTEEIIRTFQSVHKHQTLMLENLQLKKNKLDKKLKSVRAWRIVTGTMFAATAATVLISSAVVAAIAAPQVAAALAVIATVPVVPAGKWVDIIWKKIEDVLKGSRKDMVSCMEVGTQFAFRDLCKMKTLIDNLERELESLMETGGFAISEEAIKTGMIEDIKKQMTVMEESIEDLSKQSVLCATNVGKARAVILGRILSLEK